MGLKTMVTQFSAHMKTAIESISKAASVYAQALREFPNEAQEAFSNAYPHVTINTWDKLRAIGNGDLNANVMFFSDKFAAKIARIPREKQDAILNGDSFTIVNPTSRQVEKVKYSNLKPRHERIIFNDETCRIRTVEEQIAYIDLKTAEKKAKEKDYTVSGDMLTVHRACVIRKNELEGIVEEMNQ